MSLTFLKAGMQTTIQAGERGGFRHFGVPGAGPADPLSMSLANRLVGKPSQAAAFEITLIGAEIEFSKAQCVAVTGAKADLKLNRAPAHPHETIQVSAGDILTIGPALQGSRIYLAISDEIVLPEFLGSQSTYLPGGFGGIEGRILKNGEEIETKPRGYPDNLETPPELRPYFNDRFVFQVTEGPNFDLLEDVRQLESLEFTVSHRMSRMGVEVLAEDPLKLISHDPLLSSAVFPGSIQCPPGGALYVLSADAQTTGGYPHILQVCRCDRYQIGQLKQGASIRFVLRSVEEAQERYKTRFKAYQAWLDPVVI